MSAWLREAGLDRLERSREETRLNTSDDLKQFFARCDERSESGKEPDWEEHKALIEQGHRKGAG